jgi:mono/diheme cytochrome c family protein
MHALTANTRFRTFKPAARAGAALGLAWALFLAAAPALADEPKLPRGWGFTLPAGNPAAGEKVFLRMECYSCHTVSGKRLGDPAQNPGGIGPDLTPALARLPREYVAESIVNFDRIIAHGRYRARYLGADGSSRMGDYSEIMTVRELIDIVEFLKQVR